MLFYKNDTLFPFEIKKTALPTKEMIKNFKKIKNHGKKIGQGGIICFYDTLTKLDDDNYIVPISSVVNNH